MRGRKKCPSCAVGALVARAHRHETRLGGIRVTDATSRALSCTNRACGEVLLTSAELRGYERRAAALVLRDGRRATGSVFRFARKALGLIQAELALLLRVAPETVSRWETEAEPMGRQAQLSLVALLEGVERAEVDIDELVRFERGGRASVPRQLEVRAPKSAA